MNHNAIIWAKPAWFRGEENYIKEVCVKLYSAEKSLICTSEYMKTFWAGCCWKISTLSVSRFSNHLFYMFPRIDEITKASRFHLTGLYVESLSLPMKHSFRTRVLSADTEGRADKHHQVPPLPLRQRESSSLLPININSPKFKSF